MKRYLIYGFLTILIITLNFAFIIVLVSEDVRINYRVLFLLWIVVILAAAGLAYLEKTKKNQEITASSPQPAPFSPGKATNRPSATSNIYKNKRIKKFRIYLSGDVTKKLEPGFFTGYIMNEDYSNETVQAVYNQQDQLLGYLNKKKKRLCENIEMLYNEPIICWGTLKWEDFEKKLLLKGHVPILYSEPEINRFKKMMESKSSLLEMESSLDTQNIHAFLKKAENFHYLQQSRLTPPSLDYEIPPQHLNSLSEKLCREKQWEELIKLKEYPIVINRLPQQEKEEVLSRIKKAEKKQPPEDLT